MPALELRIRSWISVREKIPDVLDRLFNIGIPQFIVSERIDSNQSISAENKVYLLKSISLSIAVYILIIKYSISFIFFIFEISRFK